ncbi:uncharacterized protein LOC132758628 [Ruditapes philippinarum]|uniref:uncharacterized protein LOC132758628 n=1 Tax=Ruditapes philippinarum TaxID=129788 RepID=UPI00295B872E|nr:uncharacterized protein LOC132758628 [Ruditapes philippinarum]
MMFWGLIKCWFVLLIPHICKADVRLVGGQTKNNGRLEVRNGSTGPWGTVCDDEFDRTDAAVVCRMLGFRNTQYAVNVSSKVYGPGLGNIFLDDLKCAGNESDIFQCKASAEKSNCDHDEDVGVNCQTPITLAHGTTAHSGRLEINVNGSWKSFCPHSFNETTANVVCRMLAFSTGNVEIKSTPGLVDGSDLSEKLPVCNYGLENDITQCQQRDQTSCLTNERVEINCRTQLRLQNGAHNQSGRVEVYFEDRWNAICDDFFNDKAATVICRMLGFNQKFAKSYGRSRFGKGSADLAIAIDKLRCSGNESDLSECKSNQWGSHTTCSRNRTAAVKCATEIRLANGPTAFAGRLEIKSSGSWKTICDKDFDRKAAHVVCKMLQFDNGNVSVKGNSYYGNAMANNIDYELNCTGEEDDIMDCIRTHKYSTCKKTVGVNCYSSTPVRLVGGPTPFSGKVEVYSQEESKWKGVCLKEFSNNDAYVICKMLGKTNRNPSIHRALTLYHFVLRGHALSALNCNGNESDISDCRSKERWNESTCTHLDFVGVNCDPETPIRLVDGPSIKAGRVEIYYNGSWGGICINDLTTNDTGVMCQMLGYTRSSYILQNLGYAKGNNNITITDLNCFGNESDISDCKASPWQDGVCTSDAALWIACGSSIKLKNGSDDRSGRVEIKHNETWWTICADTFDINVANVVCRMAGFRFWNASVISNSLFGLGSGDSIIKNITCTGDEKDLSTCRSYPWEKTTCLSKQVATVYCRVQKTPLRLVNGDNPYSGRVEVFHNNKWGTVCEKRFTLADAKVVCQIAGYNFSTDVSIVSDKYDSGYTPYNVMIQNLACIGNESDISLCQSADWDTGYENCPSSNYYQSVGVNCLTTVNLVGGLTQYSGRVIITHQGHTGSICSEHFSNENIKVICLMLGFNFTTKFLSNNYTFITSQSPPSIIVENLQCTGEEIDIQECNSRPWGQTNCSNNKAVEISCNTPVELTRGESFISGRVKVLRPDGWNNICYTGNDFQDNANARVVCRTKGLSTGTVTVYNETGDYHGQLSVKCHGEEIDIGLCQISNNTCETKESLAISCDTDVKLTDGRTKYMGYVSVNLQGTHKITPNIANDKTAAMICRELGYNYTRNPEVQTWNNFGIKYNSKCAYSVIRKLHCNGDEHDVMNCRNSTWDFSKRCSTPETGINCQTPIRLYNGSQFQHGRVEIKINQTWYPVCSKSFKVSDAAVVCRMLGHKHVKNVVLLETNAENHAYYLNGNLQCNGDEDDVSQCQNAIQETNCSTSSPAYINCSTNIRLVDGPTLYKGRPEIYLNGSWGPICQNSNSKAYEVMCKMLGFNYNGAVMHYSYNDKPSFSNKTFGRTSYYVSNLNCENNGLADDISECVSNDWNSGYSCPDTQPLEIECNTLVSLHQGSNPNVGRVQVEYRDSHWSICGDNFTLENADVVCRSIGIETYRNATIYYGNKYGYSSYSIIDLSCSGDETDLQECKSAPWMETHNCNTSNRAVAVNCRPNTPVRINGTKSSGLPEFNYQGRWGTVCYNQFHTTDASVICNMLGFKKATVKCSNDRVRLVGGVNDYIGKIQFQYLGVWGSVCEKHFDSRDAEVVCREIGLQEKNIDIFKNSRFGYQSSNFTVNDLNCTGGERELDECGSYPWKLNNSPCRNAGVNCRPNTPIQLLNGTSNYTGRLEVEYKQHYGTVCDRDFDINDAIVVCRSLGYNTMSVGFKKNAFYGKGKGEITISNLNCTGNESDISYCDTPYRWAEPHEFCTHENDVSVLCNTPVRLRGGWTNFDGIVEIYINKSWNSVCYDGFTQDDAKAVCILSHLSSDNDSSVIISIHGSRYYGFENNQPSIVSLGCNGQEDDLFFCGSGNWTKPEHSCSSHESVAINCRAETEIQLVDKNGQNVNLEERKKDAVSGRVEVFYKDKWGTICDDKFDDSDAMVLCSMLNFTVGKVYRTDSKNAIGYGNGSIWIDDLDCLGTEKDISECKSEEWGVHNCEHTEDVAITCDYIDNIDPCKPKESIRLPNLDIRYFNVHTEDLKKVYNDSKLSFRWYNVGNKTFPDKKPPIDRCGTHFPIYSADTVPYQSKPVTITAKQVPEENMPIVQYKILAKHCNDGDYVYRLGPTKNDQSGYCFGIGSDEKPTEFVAEKVTVRVKVSKVNVTFQCKFDPSSKDHHLFYQVHWKITGNYHASFTKQFFNESNIDKLELTDEDIGKYDIGLGINISCAIRAFRKPNGQPGSISDFSSPYFAGLIVKDKNISLRKGETKSIEIINTMPIVCSQDFINAHVCFMQLRHMIPSDDKCANLGSFAAGSCQTQLTRSSYNNVTYVKITTSETGQYGVYGHFKVHLFHGEQSYMNKIWHKRYKLPIINVEVFPEEDRSWRKTICGARNDPHMQTFDNTKYEHHEEEGEYILYRHKTFKNVEIQHKIASCVGRSSHAKCNCGLAVRAGSDIYVINVCNRLLDIGYKRCENNALTVKKDNDLTYTIYLPYGTAVRARIDNAPWMGNEGGRVLDISVLPSVHDNKNSTGLCGSLNKNGSDDFVNRNNGTIHDNSTTKVFIKSWKVNRSESLFTNAHNMILESWTSPSCMCQLESENANTITRCDRSVADCTPGTKTGEHSCGGLSSIRTRRSLSHKPNIPIVRQTSHYSMATQHVLKKRSTDKNQTVWTMESAKTHCNQYFDSLKAFELCSKLPATHTNISVENCVLDITLSNSTEWIDITKQSMIDTCTGEIHRNATVRKALIEKAKNATTTSSSSFPLGTTKNPQNEIKAIEELKELENIEKDIKTIEEISCLNNCSGHGLCSNGECTCERGYGASDCHLDIYKAPRLQEILDNGLCDKKVSDCTHIYVFGEVFAGTNLTCRIRTFKMAVNRTRGENTETFDIKGTADTLIEAMCPIKHLNNLRKRRSVNDQPPDDFVQSYDVAISNDGQNFGNETLNVYVFDSTCQTYTNASSGMTFDLKVGFCHIQGKCVKNGSLSIQQTMVCDTRASKFGWTLLSTTSSSTSTPKTSSSTVTIDSGYTTENPKSVIAEIEKSEPGLKSYKLELTIDIILDSAHNLNSQTVWNETKIALKHYYKETLGIGLKDVVILSLQKGSLIVKHVVIVKTNEFVIKALSVALAGLSKGKPIQLFGNYYSVENVKIEDSKVGVESDHFHKFLLCESYTQLHPCLNNEECIVEKDAATCKKVSQDGVEGNTNMIIIISSTVGGVLVIVIFALITVLCCKRKKNKKGLKNRRQATVQNEYDGLPLDSLSSDDRGKKQGHENRAYKGQSKDSAVDDMTLGTGSVYNDGSYVESKDGYIYYYGKSKQEDRL